MLGDWAIEVLAVRPFTIHGDLYYELQAVRTDDADKSPCVLRVPQHAVAGSPMVGQRLVVTFLMGQVTAAR